MGLAFGILGEWSPSVSKLIDDLAKLGAPIHFQMALTRSLDIARVQLKKYMVQRLGMCVLNSRAHMLHEVLRGYSSLRFTYPAGPMSLPPAVARSSRTEPGGSLSHRMDALDRVTQRAAYSGSPHSASGEWVVP